MMRAEIDERPWGVAGGMIVAHPPQQPPPVPPMIPPPPWSENYAGDEHLEVDQDELAAEPKPLQRVAIPKPDWATSEGGE
jgi:hypothetical protein